MSRAADIMLFIIGFSRGSAEISALYLFFNFFLAYSAPKMLISMNSDDIMWEIDMGYLETLVGHSELT